MKLPVVSASKLNTYNECKSQYVAKRLLRMGTTDNPYNVLGMAFHKTIEVTYLRDKFPYDVFSAVVDAQYRLRSIDGYRGWSCQEVKAKGFNILDIFPWEEFIPAVIEKQFLLPFPNKDNPICLVNGYIDFITGTKWGRVSKDSDIIDWKTANKKPKANDVQLAFYQWAFKELYGYYPANVYIYHVQSGERIYANPLELEEIILDLEIKIPEMLSLTIEYPTERCNRCNIFCPLYRNTNGTNRE